MRDSNATPKVIATMVSLCGKLSGSERARATEITPLKPPAARIPLQELGILSPIRPASVTIG